MAPVKPAEREIRVVFGKQGVAGECELHGQEQSAVELSRIGAGRGRQT
jgi:hypothetical protein